MAGPRLLPGARALLFERLAGEEQAPTVARVHDRAALERSVTRELERLFNTRTPADAGALERRPATVMDYGIPDLSLYPPADADARSRLARHLTRAIETWEPRLAAPSVVVERVPAHAGALLARVEGRLSLDGVVETVTFGLTLGDGAADPHAG
jgi:type VI secretion system protein ImpF